MGDLALLRAGLFHKPPRSVDDVIDTLKNEVDVLLAEDMRCGDNRADECPLFVSRFLPPAYRIAMAGDPITDGEQKRRVLPDTFLGPCWVGQFWQGDRKILQETRKGVVQKQDVI